MSRILQYLLASFAIYASAQFVNAVITPRVAAASVVADIVQSKLNFSVVPDMAQWSEERKSAYAESDRGVEPLGLVEIERLGLKSPIYTGTSETVLNAGIGWIEETGVPGRAGNAALAGHRDGFFRALKDIEEGNIIRLSTHSGVTRYRVTDTEIVVPQQTSVLLPTRSAQLTLITCYPFYFMGSAPKRFIVHAVLEQAP